MMKEKNSATDGGVSSRCSLLSNRASRTPEAARASGGRGYGLRKPAGGVVRDLPASVLALRPYTEGGSNAWLPVRLGGHGQGWPLGSAGDNLFLNLLRPSPRLRTMGAQLAQEAEHTEAVPRGGRPSLAGSRNPKGSPGAAPNLVWTCPRKPCVYVTPCVHFATQRFAVRGSNERGESSSEDPHRRERLLDRGRALSFPWGHLRNVSAAHRRRHAVSLRSVRRALRPRPCRAGREPRVTTEHVDTRLIDLEEGEEAKQPAAPAGPKGKGRPLRAGRKEWAETLPKVIPYAKPYWKLLIASMFLTLGGAFVALAQPWPLALILDGVLGTSHG